MAKYIVLARYKDFSEFVDSQEDFFEQPFNSKESAENWAKFNIDLNIYEHYSIIDLEGRQTDNLVV
jgi:hypothetical protein